MNWKSQEEIKKRAEESPEEALNVSVEHWEQICEAVRMGESIGEHYESDECGICIGQCCSNCILDERPELTCCSEWRAFRSNKTLPNAQAMLNRLYLERGKRYGGKEVKKECKKERPKEIRNGDIGYAAASTNPTPVCLLGPNRHKQVLCSFFENGTSYAPNDEHLRNYIITNNIWDDLKRNGEDLEGFEAKGTGKSTPSSFRVITEEEYSCISLKTNNSAGPWCWATFDEATKIAHTILQVVATAKRREAKKDC